MVICEETKHRRPYRHRQLLDVCDVLSKHIQDSAAVHGHHVSKTKQWLVSMCIIADQNPSTTDQDTSTADQHNIASDGQDTHTSDQVTSVDDQDTSDQVTPTDERDNHNQVTSTEEVSTTGQAVPTTAHTEVSAWTLTQT